MDCDELETIIVNPVFEHKSTLIFLHGAGGTGKSFFEWTTYRLGKELRLENTKIVYPTAPKLFYGQTKANVWFEGFTVTENFAENIDSIDKMCVLINKLVETEIQNGISIKKIIIGGISMGGIMTMHYCLRYRTDIEHYFALSTFLPKESAVYKSLENNRPNIKKFFQAHGTEDMIIPMKWGMETYDRLITSNLMGEFHEYKTGHDITKKELENLTAWINKLFLIN